MVFRGDHILRTDLPKVERDRRIGFNAVLSLVHLDRMQGYSVLDYSYAQAIAFLETEGYRIYDDDFVFVYSDAVRWVLCFPVARRKTTEKYDLQTNTIDPCVVRDSCGNPVFLELITRRLSRGDRAFFCFSSATNALSDGKSVRAAESLGSLILLSPQPEDKLALVRAKEWEWDEKRQTALIQPQDVAEIELILDSEVHTLRTS
jgi:hypothetical protein